ncbi:Phospholipase A2, major isoenzyme [Desmophyllum pertusum]|uniref:Phospholipase A2 n=1 Tax=Desmophyllum pertusum TaxID=174260 RepID=A0A9W9ZZX3_9CNID|nr:Phospholipase A2, major isoenzyme [Desmophyllum pertusum]
MFLTRSTKRGLTEFGIMVLCTTKRNPFDYNLYGCYCGFGGKGEPVDEIDRCCEIHDGCYHQVHASESPVCPSSSSVYLKPYFIEGCNGCASKNDACQLAICECDSAAAKCFAKHEYNENFRNYPQSKCE